MIWRELTPLQQKFRLTVFRLIYDIINIWNMDTLFMVTWTGSSCIPPSSSKYVPLNLVLYIFSSIAAPLAASWLILGLQGTPVLVYSAL